jgi:hypothetical protein
MYWLKSKIALLLIGAIWGSFIILMLPLMLIAFAYDKTAGTHSARGWLYSLLIAQDHLTNATLGGHYLTTISSLLGHLKQSGSKTGTITARLVDLGFRIATGERNHCVNAMQSDDVYNWSTSRALLGALIYFCGVYALIIII